MARFRLALILLSLVGSGPVFAATAHWTGNMKFVTTVTYKQGISCEYSYIGQSFWRIFVGVSSCPSQVEVQ